jgi:hypothetical protein
MVKAISFDSIFPTCVSIPMFSKYRNSEKKFYRGKKVLELPETCKFTKIFFWPE